VVGDYDVGPDAIGNVPQLARLLSRSTLGVHPVGGPGIRRVVGLGIHASHGSCGGCCWFEMCLGGGGVFETFTVPSRKVPKGSRQTQGKPGVLAAHKGVRGRVS
jgi:hypothetical protein